MTDQIFENRVAFVNAAAGSGIGSTIVRALLDRGARVAATDKSQSRIDKLQVELASHYDADRFLTAVVDSSQEAAVKDILAETHAKFQRLDILVNNVGLNQLSPLAEMPLEVWQNVLSVSLTSHFLHIKHAWPFLLQSDAASIVNISSLAGQMPTAFGEAAYAAAKAGVIGLTRAASAEAKGRIRANAIVPGLIWNDNLSRAVAEEYIDLYRSRSPLGRVGTPEEVAQVVVFLASGASGHVSGETIKVAC